MKPLPTRLPELARFATVGGLCFGAGVAVLHVLTAVVGWHYLVSSALSIVLVNGLGWLLNRLWTFGTGAAPLAAEFGRYVTVNAFSFCVTMALMAACVSGLGLHYLWASVLVALLMLPLNYIAHRRLSFLQPRRS
jgi:putative flippase GtrA